MGDGGSWSPRVVESRVGLYPLRLGGTRYRRAPVRTASLSSLEPWFVYLFSLAHPKLVTDTLSTQRCFLNNPFHQSKVGIHSLFSDYATTSMICQILPHGRNYIPVFASTPIWSSLLPFPRAHPSLHRRRRDSSGLG